MLLWSRRQAAASRFGHDIDARYWLATYAGGLTFRNELRELSPDLMQAHMSSVGNQLFSIQPNLKAMTEFGRFNLLKDETTRKFDSGYLPQVVIYFTDEMKPNIYNVWLVQSNQEGFSSSAVLRRLQTINNMVLIISRPRSNRYTNPSKGIWEIITSMVVYPLTELAIRIRKSLL
jgi:hypothetical protein